MYTFTFRASMHPSLSSFDAPDAICSTRRFDHAIAVDLLNDAAWMEFSEPRAARLKKRRTATIGNAWRTFRLVSHAGKDEVDFAGLLDQHRNDFRDHPVLMPLTG